MLVVTFTRTIAYKNKPTTIVIESMATITDNTFSDVVSAYGDFISRVFANGDEYEYIRNTFSSIPFNVHSSTGTWCGSIARFIVENW